MSKLEHLKMIERLNADQHYFIAEKIAKRKKWKTKLKKNLRV